LPRGPSGRDPLGTQLRRGLPGQGRDPAAYPRQGLFERLGLHGRAPVLRPGPATPALLSHAGSGIAAVLADVLVTSAPDPRLQFYGRVLIERGELSRLGLGHKQPLGIIEDR
jgi:hypothetical protein